MPVPAVVVFGSPNKVAGRAGPGGHSAAAEQALRTQPETARRGPGARECTPMARTIRMLWNA
jgi:hypothetical protein